MEGTPSTGSPQHLYSPARQWSRLIRRNTVAESSSLSGLAIATDLPTTVQPHLDILPIWLPQQPSFHQAQLVQYNKLISSRTSAPLPPLLSTQNIQAVSGRRSSIGTHLHERRPRPAGLGGHGKKQSDKPVMTNDKHLARTGAKALDLKPVPARPAAQQHVSSLSMQSNSVPTTPHQRPRKLSFESREPSPTQTGSHSPRSAYSESNLTYPPPKNAFARLARCPYETAMALTRRRMAYKIGSERLPKLTAAEVKSSLSADEEKRLTRDMRQVFDDLLPTAESEARRMKLVAKLEKLFNTEWPGHDIQVHMFGSSGNLLCTDTSDGKWRHANIEPR